MDVLKWFTFPLHSQFSQICEESLSKQLILAKSPPKTLSLCIYVTLPKLTLSGQCLFKSRCIQGQKKNANNSFSVY